MEKTKIRTGIFGGSFNPIHIGHLALANFLCEFGEVDEIWFLVSPQNPFKQQQNLLDDNMRLRLVEASVADYPKFRASDFEFNLPKPSYTVHTLEKLSETYPERDFYLIIGADNWAAFDRWKSPEQILANHHLLVYPRKGYDIDKSSLPERVKAVETPLLEVSSTFIRQCLNERKDIRYFLHPNAYRIIQEKGLYQSAESL